MEYLDTIKLLDGTVINRYKNYFSGKMEIVESVVSRCAHEPQLNNLGYNTCIYCGYDLPSHPSTKEPDNDKE